MKNLATYFTCFACSMVTTILFGQGTINWNNTASTLISVNGSSMPARVSPTTTYYFGLFVAPLGTPAPTFINDPNWQNILAYATNHTAVVGRFLSGGIATAIGYTSGSNVNFVVRGWRTYSGEYVDWQAINSEGGWNLAYFGQSAMGTATLGGLSPGGLLYPTPNAFGGLPSQITGFNLNWVGCPECVPPFFYTRPSSAVVGLGGNAAFRAGTGIWPPTSFQWRKEGMPIAATNSSTLTDTNNVTLLTITNVTLADVGNYDVIAVNGYGTSTSSVVTLAVLTPATIGSPAYTANNQFQFTVTGSAGSNYVVQVATNLSTPTTWISLFTNISPFTFVDSNAQNFPQRLYRAQAR